jgi:hypothetical protein
MKSIYFLFHHSYFKFEEDNIHHLLSLNSASTYKRSSATQRLAQVSELSFAAENLNFPSEWMQTCVFKSMSHILLW